VKKRRDRAKDFLGVAIEWLKLACHVRREIDKPLIQLMLCKGEALQPCDDV
jgi:hypothetical protein